MSATIFYRYRKRENCLILIYHSGKKKLALAVATCRA